MKKYKHQIGVGGLRFSDLEKQLVNQVLESNNVTYGAMTKQFEKEFAEMHDVEYALFMNSGTSALHLALATLKEKFEWSDGDEVIVPAVTFVATSNIVLHNNMVPVFVDVQPDTYNIDPNLVEDKITSKTKAIIPVHLLGLPAEMNLILEIAKRYNLHVIEDSAECMFAKYEGKSVGSFGSIGCFSTYVAHFIVTGVGGFATTNDHDLAVRLRSLMNHGRDGVYISSTDDVGLQGKKLFEVVNKRFSFIHVGHSFRCTEMEAAIGVGQLKRADEIVKRRKEIANKFTTELSKYQDFIQLPVCPKNRTHMFMLYGIVMKRGGKKDIVNYLEQLNIETRDLLPLINQPIYKELFGDLEKHYPVARHINKSGFYIGCHSYMSDNEVEFVIDAFKSYFDKK